MYVVILGAGRIGASTARWLVAADHEVATVDQDEPKCAALDSELGGISVVGDGTEAGVFSALGDIPTVVCGPGSIEQAHKPDEFIELDQLGRCEVFLDKLLAVLVK